MSNKNFELIEQQNSALITGQLSASIEIALLLDELRCLRNMKDSFKSTSGKISDDIKMLQDHTRSLISGQLRAFIETAKMAEQIKNQKTIIEHMHEVSEFKDEMLSIAAHDLRTPLSVIHMSASLLQRYADKMTDDEKNEALESIVKKSKYMVKMLDELLDITMIESGKLKLNFSLGNVSQTILEQCSAAIPLAESKNINIHTQIDMNIPDIQFDEFYLAEVLNNLLSNAVKYTKPNGFVCVKVQFVDNSVHICVKDNGVGIKECEMAKLFKKFSKTGARPTGGESSTGLGLAIAKKIIDLHQGKIWAESRYGEGSCFHISLPVCQS